MAIVVEAHAVGVEIESPALTIKTPRTTVAKVEGILEFDVDVEMFPFLVAAAHLVTRVCANQLDTDGDSFYADYELELIERWLAAFFYALRDQHPNASAEKAGSVGENYRGKVDLGLDFNQYGQMAKRLDVAGGLAALDELTETGVSRRAGVSWLGTSKANAKTHTQRNLG